MGMTAAFRQITPDQLAQIQRDPGVAYQMIVGETTDFAGDFMSQAMAMQESLRASRVGTRMSWLNTRMSWLNTTSQRWGTREDHRWS